MRLQCWHCHKSVSSELPDDALFRAIAVCPECIALSPENINHPLQAADSVKRVDVSEPWSWTCKCGVKRFAPGSCDVCLMGYTAPADWKESDFDICECGHSREAHVISCWHAVGKSDICKCEKFTLAATVAHDEPVEMCECGHEKKIHRKENLACWHTNSNNGFDCPCLKYTPIPAHLRSDTQNP